MSDISSIIVWWLSIFLIGSIFLPVTFLLFDKFVDKGYAFSKILGLVLSSYLIWLLGSLHILPFTKISLIIVFLTATLINLWLIKKIKRGNGPSFPIWLFAIEEILFLLGLVFWSYIRAFEPSIRGLEKFMDFGFVNSILRAEYFPPLDMWLTKSPDYTGGFFINYYYYGHYINAFLTKLTSLDSAITYNLMLATIFAFALSLTFSLGVNLLRSVLLLKANVSRYSLTIKPLFVGLLAAFLLSLGGNLHTLYTLTEGYPNESPKPPWQLSLGYHPEKYWYPNATRFIPFTIHEFPIYSFVVADLHGHFSDIPMVLLTLGILFALISKSDAYDKEEKRPDEIKNNSASNFLDEFARHTGVSFFILALLGLLLGVMYMTNAWDGLIYMVTAGLAILYYNLKNKGLTLSTIYKTFSASLFLVFFFLVVNLPFSLNFKPFVSGVGVLCAPNFLVKMKTLGPLMFEADHCQRSPVYQLAILWGFFYFNVAGFIALIVIPRIKLVWSAKNNIRQSARKKSSVEADVEIRDNSKLMRIIRELYPSDVFIMILIFISTLLLIFPELFYMKDIYPAHYRANTMFKLGYQAFMMLSIVSAYAFIRVVDNKWELRRSLFRVFYQALFIPLFTLVAIYPYFAIYSYYNGLKNYQGLYGLNWMSTQYLDDYKVVSWMRKNITGQPVVAEANGDSYTDYDRVSAYTGLPTIVGWPVHEWLWRGSYDEAGRRIPEVAKIYESQDLEEIRSILRKYNTEYIFVGSLERDKYKNFSEENIKKLGKVVFESGNTRLYRLNQDLVNSPILPAANPTPTITGTTTK